MEKGKINKEITVLHGIDALSKKLDILIRLSVITLIILVSAVILFLVRIQDILP